MSMKVIGVGGPRTGTASLKDALEILGFGRCYHMEWLFNHQEDLKYWHELFNTGKTDFDRLFQGCQSTVDFPGYLNYKALYKQYPEAKFILNDRDPEAWYESAKHTVHSVTPTTIPEKMKMLRKMIFSRRLIPHCLVICKMTNNANRVLIMTMKNKRALKKDQSFP